MLNNNRFFYNLENYSKLPEEIKEELKVLRKMEYVINQSVIMAITDRKGCITYVNDLLCEVSQYKRGELIGQRHEILYSQSYKDRFIVAMLETVKRGQVWKGEILSRKKDGSHYWIHTTIVPFINDENDEYQYYSISKEITKEKEIEEDLKRSHENYRLIAENTINLVTLLKTDGSFQYISPSFNSILDYDVPTLMNENFFNIVHPEDLKTVKEDVQTYCRKRKEPLLMEFQILHPEGEYIDVEASIRAISNTSYSNEDLILVVMRDIRGRKEIEQKIYHLAYHDPLTNFPNRRSFMIKLRDEILNRRKTKEKMAILFIDLDNFKSINDQWGHDMGDLVLKEAAIMIQSSICPSDVAARLGGDEFMVMLKSIRDDQDTINVVQSILKKFQSPLFVDGQEFIITCSIGIANYPEHGRSSEELMKNADDALYSVKGQGKNNFIIFNKSIENKTLERRLLENALRKAIKKQEFYLEYQPKLNISTNEIIGMEALVRWNHPDLGTIPPVKFISLAESTGLIIPLGEWILRESCRQTKEWQEKGYPQLRVSVNVSVRQFEDPYFIEKIKRILHEIGLDPHWLEIELTESVFADLKHTVPILEEIRNLGIHISVDDFGTGYSSLSYIKHLPIDTLKVDQSFIKDVHLNHQSKAIVSAVIHLAETIGLNVIAEGIETLEHVEALSKDGLKFGQGYFYSRPLRCEAFEEFVTNNASL